MSFHFMHKEQQKQQQQTYCIYQKYLHNADSLVLFFSLLAARLVAVVVAELQ